MAAAPYLLNFEQFGNAAEGFLTTTQFARNVPFDIKRIFWVQHIPENILRGQHANMHTEEVLVALQGTIQVRTETADGIQHFELTGPDQGLYIPALCWTGLRFTQSATGLCLASTDFNDADYIRDHNMFKQLLSNRK